MKNFKTLATTLGTALLLAACGGGDPAPKIKFTAVKTMGDSMSDNGTFAGLPAGSGFGRIFSVQGNSHLIWTERTAAAAGINSLCSVYKFTGATFVANPAPGCTSFAIGGGRINYLGAGGAANPLSVVKQLQDSALVGNHKATDLLLIDGGGNDAADLVGAYLGTATGAAGVAVYSNMLSTVLAPALVGATLATGATGFASVGGMYMTALANNFFDAIKTQALDKGATHVAILNMPSITNTPRFQMVLDGIAATTAASSGTAAGAVARAQSEALFRSWIQAFNTQLKTRTAGNGAVVLVDLSASMDDQIAHPAQYGLTNVKTPACPITGLGADNLPSYNFETCTDVALSAQTPPPGASGGVNWWKTYGFSDGFHPTPYGHQLVTQLVSKELTAAGWL